MNKRSIFEISPEQYREEKRRLFISNPPLSATEPSKSKMSTTAITIDTLKQILNESNKQLINELPSKADFQVLHAELSGLKTKYDDISAKVICLEQRNNELEDRIDDLLQKSLESNVVVHMPLEANTDMNEKAKSVCAGLLGIADTSSVVEYAHSVSAPTSRTAMIIVKLNSRTAAWKILRNTKNLKGTQIHVHKDLPYNTRRRKTKLLPIAKFLRAKFPRVKIQLKDDKLFIANKLFTWDLTRGLNCGSNEPLEVLRNIFGGDHNLFSDLQNFMNEVERGNKIVRNVNHQMSSSSMSSEVGCIQPLRNVNDNFDLLGALTSSSLRLKTNGRLHDGME